MSKDLDIFWVTEELAMPTAHSLSQYKGVGGCGCPKFSRIARSSVAIQAAAKTPAYSDSATKERTTGILVEWAEMGWFTQESSRLEPRKW